MGVRLTDIVFDRNEDHLYEDERAMRLTPYVMAERCTQVEVASLFTDKEEGDYTVLSEILGQGCKGYHNMDSSELIEEYKQIEELWYELESCNGLYWEPCEDDPIHTLKETV
jgi:hypothetical protein